MNSAECIQPEERSEKLVSFTSPLLTLLMVFEAGPSPKASTHGPHDHKQRLRSFHVCKIAKVQGEFQIPPCLVQSGMEHPNQDKRDGEQSFEKKNHRYEANQGPKGETFLLFSAFTAEFTIALFHLSIFLVLCRYVCAPLLMMHPFLMREKFK